MKLGIIVNTDKHAREVVGLTKAAASKGHEVTLFMTDDGVKLLHNSSVADLYKIPGVTCNFCQHSTEMKSVITDGVSEKVICGSQYDNAIMNDEADRVIVL